MAPERSEQLQNNELPSGSYKTRECHPVVEWDIRESTWRILPENPPSAIKRRECQDLYWRDVKKRNALGKTSHGQDTPPGKMVPVTHKAP